MLDEYMQTDLPPTKLRVENVKKKWHVIIYKNQIIKQADTIEELCDWYVYIEDGKIKYLFEDWDTAFSYLGQCFEISDYQNWYGAIETDKGLIYVAKLNEKGFMELL